MDNKIGLQIREARLKAGLKQKELADRIGVSESRISQYERGSQNPRISTLIKLAEALEIPLKTLCGDQWEQVDYEARTEHYSPFLKYLGSLGYQVEGHRTTNSLGNLEIHYSTGGYVVVSPNKERTTFTGDQFQQFEKAIADSVEYQIWQQRKTN